MLKLHWDNDQLDGDINSVAGGAEEDNTLQTAIIMSLFCEGRVPAADVPEGTGLGGWWAESYFDEPDTWGCRLWACFRMKATAATLRYAKQACEDALQWMIDDGVADSVSVTTWWIESRPGYMGILPVITKPGSNAPAYNGAFQVFYEAT